ncbi:MAG: UDP-N-acetylmuramoyl-L-alanyl-D-glutamate--2,6-diaminopimelate ligase [Hyphomicrobiales bacterium]
MYISESLEFKKNKLFIQNHEITQISNDSRDVINGSLFFLIEEDPALGKKYIEQAVTKGAAAIVVSNSNNFINQFNNSIILRSKSVRKDLAKICSRFYKKYPKNIIAVTGTNGKTSVAKFTEQIWSNNGILSASIGTLGNSKIQSDNALTTPDPISLHKQLADLSEANYDNVIIEASSHGLNQSRIDGLHISGAAFTNFSRDHLDYHKNMISYFNAKKRLFTELLTDNGTAVINKYMIPDKYHNFIDEIRSKKIVTIGNKDSTVVIEKIYRREDQMVNLECIINSKLVNVETRFIASFQAINSLIAACLSTINTNISLMDSIKTISNLNNVIGRLECVASTGDNNYIYIDYAHTPDAIKSALIELRQITSNRLFIVFGAGGDRDIGKRALMSAVASKYADYIIITDDNPRSEDPSKIRSELMQNSKKFIEISDRGEAISHAISKLSNNDSLLICGKGHEGYIQYKDKRVSFSDHATVSDILSK